MGDYIVQSEYERRKQKRMWEMKRYVPSDLVPILFVKVHLCVQCNSCLLLHLHIQECHFGEIQGEQLPWSCSQWPEGRSGMLSSNLLSFLLPHLRPH